MALRSDSGWDLARVVDGEAEVLLSEIETFAPGREHFAVVVDGEVALWDGRRTRTLHRCPSACYELAWSPDGGTLVWVEEGPAGSYVRAVQPGRSEIRSLGETLGRPVWAPGAAQLAFPAPAGIVTWAPGEGVTETLPFPVTGQVGWTPGGAQLTAPLASGALVLLEPGGALPRPLTLDLGTSRVEGVAWSPAGEHLLVLLRRFSPPETSHDEEEPHDERPGAESLGAQPWLYDAEDGTLAPLPGDPAAAFAHPAWSPDGRYLALTYIPVGSPGARPEVWVFDVTVGEVLYRVSGAAAPDWSAER